MKGFVIIFVLIAVVVQSNAETWSINGTDAAYPGQCVYEGKPYEPGEFVIKNRCIRLICGTNNWISAHSCVEGFVEGCERSLPTNVKRPFPECCKRTYKCKHGDGTEYEFEDF